MTDLDPDLTALRERWSPEWKIWRARREHDTLPTGSYCASRIDDRAGLVPFLMAQTAQQLHTALEAQTHAVLTGATTAPEPPVHS